MNMPGRVRSSPPFGSAQGKVRETATGGASGVALEYGWASPRFSLMSHVPDLLQLTA